jgi:hypothetical protein
MCMFKVLHLIFSMYILGFPALKLQCTQLLKPCARYCARFHIKLLLVICQLGVPKKIIGKYLKLTITNHLSY